jgi:photosystem II stability/assembly factor-like uncharacterized protein
MYYTSIAFLVGIFLTLSLSPSSFAGNEGALPHQEMTPQFERIGPFGGDVRSLLVDARQPDIVYMGSSNGKIFKSYDGGRSWNSLFPGIDQPSYVIAVLVQHPRERDRIYAGAWDLHTDGGGLFESRDAGATWNRLPLSGGGAAVRGLAISTGNPSYMLAATLSGVQLSTDAGKSWNSVGAEMFQRVKSVGIDPADPRFLYAGTYRLSYRSSDYGKTWRRVEKGMPLDSDIFSIAIHPQNPSIVYASACSGVYRSSDRMQSWTRLRVVPDRMSIRAQVIYIDPVNPRRIYTGTTEGLFVSQNEGNTWTRLTSRNISVNAVQVDPADNRRVKIGTEYQGVLVSADQGRNWQETNQGFIHKQIAWIMPNQKSDGRLIAGVTSGAGGLYNYDNRSLLWTHSEIESGMRVLSFLYLPDGKGKLIGASQGVYFQAGDSDHWEKLPGLISRRTVHSLELDPTGTVIYAGTDNGIYRSSPEEMDFYLPHGNRFSPRVWSLYAPRSNPEIVYAGTSLGIFQSADRGTTWKVLSTFGLPERAVIDTIAVSPSDTKRLFSGTSAGLYESVDGGVSWYRSAGGSIGTSISSIIFLDETGDRIVAADKTNGGLHYTMDGGNNWARLFSAEFNSPVNCVMRDPGKPAYLYLGTRSEGVYRLILP